MTGVVLADRCHCLGTVGLLTLLQQCLKGEVPGPAPYTVRPQDQVPPKGRALLGPELALASSL